MIYQLVKLVGFMFVGVWFSGCIEHEAEPQSVVVSHEVEKVTNKPEKDYKGYKMYEGKIPCEKCSSIFQRLVIKGDTMGIYRLTEVYDNEGAEVDPTVISTGQWRRITQKNKELLELSQGTLNDSIRRMEYEVQSKMLIQVSLDDEYIVNKNAYHLKLVKQSAK